MIDPDTRHAMYQLHRAGMPLREISRQFRVSRNTVRAVIRREGAMPELGEPVRVVVNRAYLTQAARHGFERLYLFADKQPITAADDLRRYGWSPRPDDSSPGRWPRT